MNRLKKLAVAGIALGLGVTGATGARSAAVASGGCMTYGGGTRNLSGFVVSPSNQHDLWASTGLGVVYASTDGGRHWTVRGRHAPGPIVAIAGDQNMLFVIGGRGLYASTDGGHSWKAWTCAMEATAVAPTSSGRSVLVTSKVDLNTSAGGGLYRTTDAGTSWTRDTNLPAHNLNVYAVIRDSSNAAVVYAAPEAGGVLRSVDGGPTLQLANGWPPDTRLLARPTSQQFLDRPS